MHFTVMAFNSGTGEPIMCAKILKQNKETKDLPMSSTMGIDITKNIKTGKTDYETYQLNVENDACIGGPKCRYDCKKIHCFVCSSPNASIKSGLLATMLQ